MNDEKTNTPAINVLVLAAARMEPKQGERDYPPCLTEFDGKSVLERIVQNTSSLERAQYAFAFLQPDAQRFHLERIVALLAPGARTTRVPVATQGAACTALLAASQLDANAELLIISANELVDLDLGRVVRQWRERGLDAGTLVFRSLHPRYSYVRYDSAGFVIEAAQRVPISNSATAGLFWFARTSDFTEGAKNMIRKGGDVEGLYFVAPVFNELILRRLKVGAVELDPARYFPLKNERQVEQLERERGR